MSDLLIEGKSTAVEQTEERTHYSELNETRMHRLDKTIKITEENATVLKNLSKSYLWLVLTESWCGDAAQILPVLNKMALESNKKIEMKIALRDENEDAMNRFLTNGTRAIPKLIIIEKATGAVLGHWGPRPKGAVEFMNNYKKEHGVIDETAKAELQLWYLHDKGLSTQNEIIQLLETSFIN